jgi:hypothetical protein
MPTSTVVIGLGLLGCPQERNQLLVTLEGAAVERQRPGEDMEGVLLVDATGEMGVLLKSLETVCLRNCDRMGLGRMQTTLLPSKIIFSDDILNLLDYMNCVIHPVVQRERRGDCRRILNHFECNRGGFKTEYNSLSNVGFRSMRFQTLFR